MISVRKANERGHASHGWLDTYHSFSFADYYDENFVQFRSLRVLNEDFIAANSGFGMHPHRNMEILTYVVSGSLAHEDSLGHSGEIRPGEVQHISAGKGILHSERNPSLTDSVHLLQIWLTPERDGLTPAYQQRKFPLKEKAGELVLLASPDGRENSLKINQKTDFYALKLEPRSSQNLKVRKGQAVWIQVVKGVLTIDGQYLSAGDGAAVEEQEEIRFESCDTDVELVAFHFLN